MNRLHKSHCSMIVPPSHEHGIVGKLILGFSLSVRAAVEGLGVCCPI